METKVTALRGEAAAPELLRIPPHNTDAEQALLGAIFFNNAAYGRVAEFLQPGHFGNAVHGRIFAAIGKLIERGQNANPVTLKNLFDQDGALAEIGGAQYLKRLADSAITIINAEDYGRIIHDLYLRRQLIALGENVVNDAFRHDLDDPAREQIERAEKTLFDLATAGQTEGGFRPFGAALLSAIDNAEAAFKKSGKTVGVATGFEDIDKMLGGLHPSDLIVLAGRPSMGKAQPLDARIRTVDGWKTMGELRLGDRLASVDGRPSRVAGLFPQGKRQLFRVTFSDGRHTECCGEHLWRVHFRGWSAPRLLTTAEVAEKLGRRRYRNRLWIDMPSGDFGHQEPLPLDPWLLGALLGDGKRSGGSPLFSTAEPELLAALSARAGESLVARAAGGYDWRIVQAAGRWRAGVQGVSPNPVKEALVELGLWGLRSEERFIPDRYLGAARPARLELLRGLLDTDGWIERRGSVRFASSSERLAKGVVALVRSLGGWASLRSKKTTYTYRGEKRDGLPTYVCNIAHPSPQFLFSSHHKAARAQKGREQNKRPTFLSITPTRIAEAQCIAVTHPDHLYITDDYVVTHNTALATNIAFNAARAYKATRTPDGRTVAEDGAVVGFFSLEMSAEQLATRIVAEESGISSDRIRRGAISSEDFEKLMVASGRLQPLKLFVDDTPALSVGALRTRARRLMRQQGLGLIIVDYLQLMQASRETRAQENRVQEISEITRGLKALAKELNIPVLAISQLSRAVESREDKRPMLADLRESGSIEQDADVVMFIFREEYYLSRLQPMKKPDESEEKYEEKIRKWQDECERVYGLAEVIVAKQRHGPIGTVKLRFEGSTTKFDSYMPSDHLPAVR